MLNIFLSGQGWTRTATQDGFILTTASFSVMNEAKCVGTKPGATQFTRVFGAISAASAQMMIEKELEQGKNLSMICLNTQLI